MLTGHNRKVGIKAGKSASRQRCSWQPQSRSLVTGHSLRRRWHRKRGVWLFSRDEPGGCLDYWPGGARREGGVILVCGSGTEREKASGESVDPGS